MFKVSAVGGSTSGGKGNQEAYLCGESEEEVFASLGLQFIQPELREDLGEIEFSAQGKLPQLLTLKDIKGDLTPIPNIPTGKTASLRWLRPPWD